MEHLYGMGLASFQEGLITLITLFLQTLVFFWTISLLSPMDIPS
jgi:hypothetical protein